MDEMFVILDENEVPLCASDNPWGDDQECLINDLPGTFTVFLQMKEAERWLDMSKKVAKKDKLTSIWEIKKWKIVTLAEYLRESSK